MSHTRSRNGQVNGSAETVMQYNRVPAISVTKFENFLIRIGLQDFIKSFTDQGIDMESLLVFTNDELKKFVPKIGYWSRLCTALERYRNGLYVKTEDSDIEALIEYEFPYAGIRELFAAHGVSKKYASIFEENGVGLQELHNLPEGMLRNIVPATGHWKKVCLAKQALIANQGSNKTSQANYSVNNISEAVEDPLREFLRSIRLDGKYFQLFKEHEMEYQDVISIEEDRLMSIIGKAGPVHRIVQARKKFLLETEPKPVNCFSGPSSSAQASDADEGECMELEEKTLNILLLGETGVGKSTFINAFANYLNFESMEAALQNPSGIFTLIPTSFAVTDENFQRHTISVGNLERNESVDEGQSSTQSCRSYYFPFSALKIRLIDTPGIGDTRGIQQDKINLDNILAFIGQHEDLHGICILLKPNTSRLTASFTFCIKELLCHLQKDASRNIIFVFTNSRGTFYKPGDTAPTLEKILNEIHSTPPHVLIPFVHKTVYCFDSESYRFLLAVNQGLKFQGDQHQIFSESWNISVKECMRMIGYINELKPHKVKDTVSINEARRLIIELSKPIAEFTQNINVNLQVISDRREELLLSDADIKDLEQKLKVPVVDLIQIPLSQPTTVCTASKCIQVHTIGLSFKTNYVTRCHSPCYLKGVQAELMNNTALLGCTAMGGRKYCQHCGCSYEVHMHIYYELEEKDTYLEDETVKAMITRKADGKLIIAQSIDALEKRSAELVSEKELLTKTVAKFAIFLKTNAIAPYNDAFEDYLEHLISNERTKQTVGAKNKGVIEGMQRVLKEYNEEKDIFDKLMNATDGAQNAQVGIVTAADIIELERKLYGLKIYGERIRDFRKTFSDSRMQAQKSFSETVHPPPDSTVRRFIRRLHRIRSGFGFSDYFSNWDYPFKLRSTKNSYYYPRY